MLNDMSGQNVTSGAIFEQYLVYHMKLTVVPRHVEQPGAIKTWFKSLNESVKTYKYENILSS